MTTATMTPPVWLDAAGVTGARTLCGARVGDDVLERQEVES
jgi:hypothetical protein